MQKGVIQIASPLALKRFPFTPLSLDSTSLFSPPPLEMDSTSVSFPLPLPSLDSTDIIPPPNLKMDSTSVYPPLPLTCNWIVLALVFHGVVAGISLGCADFARSLCLAVRGLEPSQLFCACVLLLCGLSNCFVNVIWDIPHVSGSIATLDEPFSREIIVLGVSFMNRE